jgi:hypothetical protein
VEEGVNFVWTVPGVTGSAPGGFGNEIAVRKSLGTLRELAALDRNHLGPALVALKGSVFVDRLHAEQQARRGKNLGYRLNKLTLDEDGRAVFRQDPLDLEVDMAEGKTMQVAHVGPNRVFPLGCPALKIKAFTAAARCVIDVFDQHELWPAVQPG